MEKVSHTYIPDDTFADIMETVPVCTVDIFFLNKNKDKVLLFKRLNQPLKGTFFSVGGRIFKNEKIEDAAIRQARREAGIILDRDKLFGLHVQEEIHDSSIFDGISYHAITLCYGYTLDEDARVTLDNQHSEFKWFDVTDFSIHPFIRKKIDSLL